MTAYRWKKISPKTPFHRMSRDKIVNDSWSILAALFRVKPKSYRPEGRRTPYLDFYNGVTG